MNRLDYILHSVLFETNNSKPNLEQSYSSIRKESSRHFMKNLLSIVCFSCQSSHISPCHHYLRKCGLIATLLLFCWKNCKHVSKKGTIPASETVTDSENGQHCQAMTFQESGFILLHSSRVYKVCECVGGWLGGYTSVCVCVIFFYSKWLLSLILHVLCVKVKTSWLSSIVWIMSVPQRHVS